jgi:hypothetical protein
MAKTPLVKNVNTKAQNQVIRLIAGTPFCSSTSITSHLVRAVLRITEIGGIGADISVWSDTHFLDLASCTHRRDAVQEAFAIVVHTEWDHSIRSANRNGVFSGPLVLRRNRSKIVPIDAYPCSISGDAGGDCNLTDIYRNSNGAQFRDSEVHYTSSKG